MAKPGTSGGTKLRAALEIISKKIESSATLRAGFLEGATYPDGTPVAYVASINEFGATIEMPARTQTVERVGGRGRFVKAGKGTVTTHDVAAHTVTIPARPFFRPAVKDQGAAWGKALGQTLKNTAYDVPKALGQVGTKIEGDITDSIKSVTEPPNALSTVRRKGASKPLIDSGVMWQSVSSEVSDEPA